MNKVLILILMMLSFISKAEGKPKKTTPDENAKKIQQDTSISNESTETPTPTGSKKPIKTKAEGFKERKKKNTTLTNLSKIKKFKKPNQKKDFLIRNKKIILIALLTVITACAIFRINHIEVKGKKVQQQLQKLTPEELLQERKRIQEKLKSKSFSYILEDLVLKDYMERTTIKNLKDFNRIIIREYQETETHEAIIKVFKWREVIEDYEDRDCYKINKETIEAIKRTGGTDLDKFQSNYKFKIHIDYLVNKNMIKLIWKEGGKVQFSDPRDINQPITFKGIYNKGKLITEIESKNIQSLIDAIVKLRKIFSNQYLNPKELKEEKESDFTLEEVRDFFNINYHDILQKNPLEVNEYIEKFEGILKKNKDPIQQVFSAQNKIKNPIEKSRINKFKESDLRLRLGFNNYFNYFVLREGPFYYKSLKDNNHQNCEICVTLYNKLTLKFNPEKNKLKKIIKKTLEEICNIITGLNEKTLKAWQEMILEINNLLKKPQQTALKTKPTLLSELTSKVMRN